MNGLIFFALFAAALLLIPAGVFAQERGPTKEEIIATNYSGPVFLDAFWTSGSSSQNGTEVDVDPGDGASTLAVVLINRGPSDIAGITGRLTLPAGFEAIGKSAGVPAVATFNQVAPVGSTFTLFFDIDVLDFARVGEYNAPLSVDYSRFFETGSPRNVQTEVSFRITGEAIVDVSRVLDSDGNASSQISAGKIEEFSLSVANEGTAPITNVVVTLKSPSDSLKILGESKWTIQRIEQDSQVELSTMVFAATTMIGNPASLDVTVAFSSNGRSNTEAFVLGTYVAGEISISAYEIGVEYIGGTPNIVGNLLNEGNTLALFTTIKVTSAENLVSDLPPSQYVGDLEENSPLPFSIPVQVDDNSGAGTYPISLKITYKDSLREEHSLEIGTEVHFVPEQPEDESSQGGGIFASLPFGIGIVVAAAIAAAVAFRRKKRSTFRRNIQSGKQDEDIDSVLDSHEDDRK